MIEYKVGSEESLLVRVTHQVEVLDAQSVEISVNRGGTWHPAEWVGEPGRRRFARTVAKVTFPAPMRGQVLARIDGAIAESDYFKVTAL
jgi:hypothetical protein